ncbi:hypothetical protein CCP3SC15_1240013 [Gammaproteobacteria bacterium]
MIPATLTVDAIMGGAAGTVVPYFGALLLLVLVVALGIWAVGFIIRTVRSGWGGGGGKRRR